MKLDLPYVPPTGGPLYWLNEKGELNHAVARFLNEKELTPAQFELVRAYCVYFVKAPCWRIDRPNEFQVRLGFLEQARTTQELKTALRSFVLEFGIDPI